MKTIRLAPSLVCIIVTGLLTGGFSSEPIIRIRAQHRDFRARVHHGLQGDPLHHDPDRKRCRGAQLSHRDALVSFIHKRGHGAVHQVHGFLCCFALVLVANILLTLLLTLSNSLFVRRRGSWNFTLSLRRFLLPFRHEGGALEAWVPEESKFAGSDSQSGQLGAKTLGSWGGGG